MAVSSVSLVSLDSLVDLFNDPTLLCAFESDALFPDLSWSSLKYTFSRSSYFLPPIELVFNLRKKKKKIDRIYLFLIFFFFSFELVFIHLVGSKIDGIIRGRRRRRRNCVFKVFLFVASIFREVKKCKFCLSIYND